MMNRHLLPILLALTSVSILSGLILIFPLLEEDTTEILYGPADFYGVSKEVNLTELLLVANYQNISVYLPSNLPYNLDLTAIYLKESPFIAILVYSSEGNKDYKTAEMGFQITNIGIEHTPSYDELQSDAESDDSISVLIVNDWLVFIDENAAVGSNAEHRDKFGEYHLVVTAYYAGFRYKFSFPTLTTEEAIQVINSMTLQIL